jgi:hypothetical protein
MLRAWKRFLAFPLLGGALVLVAILALGAGAQEPGPPTAPLQLVPCMPPVPFTPPAATPSDRPRPINLPTALQLGHARGIDIALASQRIAVAAALGSIVRDRLVTLSDTQILRYLRQ